MLEFCELLHFLPSQVSRSRPSFCPGSQRFANEFTHEKVARSKNETVGIKLCRITSCKPHDGAPCCSILWPSESWGGPAWMAAAGTEHGPKGPLPQAFRSSKKPWQCIRELQYIFLSSAALTDSEDFNDWGVEGSSRRCVQLGVDFQTELT